MGSDPIECRPADGDIPVVHVQLKVVPGASRAAVAGPLGDHIKVRVTAAPESGRANKAVLALLAKVLGVPPAALRLVRGQTTPRKTIEIRGVEAAEVRRRLGADGR